VCTKFSFYSYTTQQFFTTCWFPWSMHCHWNASLAHAQIRPFTLIKKKYFLDNGNRNSSMLHIIYVTVSQTENISDFISQGLHFQNKCTWYSSTSCFYRLTLKTSTQYINYTVLSYRRIFLGRLTAKNSSNW